MFFIVFSNSGLWEYGELDCKLSFGLILQKIMEEI